MRTALGLLLLAVACGEASDPCERVAPTVALETGDPVFHWDAACPAGAVDVAQPENPDSPAWVVLADPGKNTIRSPVTYGIGPEGTGVMIPADSLLSGRQYRFRVLRTTGPGGLGLVVVGQVDFTVP